MQHRALGVFGALLPLVLGIPGAAAAPVWLRGQTDTRLELEVLIDSRSYRPVWRRQGDRLLGRVVTRQFTAEVELQRSNAGAELSFAVSYHRAVHVRREALRLHTRGTAFAIDRRLRFGRVGAGLRIDRGTPSFVLAGQLAVTADHGFVATEVRQVGRNSQVSLIAFDAGAHPLRRFVECRMLDPTRPHKRIRTIEVRRQAGQRIVARATLYARARSAEPIPLIVERWSNGQRAAVVFTDHADRTDADALRAIMYGTSDRRSTRYNRGGFAGHGVKLTKTFFIWSKRGGLKRDAAARALADELTALGHEVGLHSMTPYTESREQIRRGFATARRWRPTTWIDHQPESNCEALANRGATDHRKYKITDLLVAHGVRWVWADTDATAKAQNINVFLPNSPRRPAPAIFPLHSEPRLWVFRSNNFFASPRVFADALRDRALQRLEEQRGLLIAHTYLSTSKRTTIRRSLDALHLTRQRRDGHYEIVPKLDQALARIARRIKAGTLASLTAAEASQRLVDLEAVRVRYTSDGGAYVHNTGTRLVRGLTLAAPRAGVQLVVNGRPTPVRYEAGRSTTFFDLPAGGRAFIELRRGRTRLSLLATQQVQLSLTGPAPRRSRRDRWR